MLRRSLRSGWAEYAAGRPNGVELCGAGEHAPELWQRELVEL